MNAEAFLKDRGVPYYTVGQELFFDCPFCGDTKKRFYWNRVSGYTYCHNCEWRSRYLPSFIAEYEGISFEAAERMVQSESSTGMRGLRSRLAETKAETDKDAVHIELPLGFRPLTREKTKESLPYWHYLTKVRQIPEHVVIEYGIGYTQLGKYAWRVVIPIVFGGRLVSWVARDATGKASRKVLTPYGNQQSEYLMNWDKVKDRDTIVLVEGPFDCLRLHNDAVASFGQVLHKSQSRLLRSCPAKEIVVLYDSEKKASLNALKAAEVLHYRKDVRIGLLPEGKDPADLPEEVVWKCVTKAEPYRPGLRGRI